MLFDDPFFNIMETPEPELCGLAPLGGSESFSGALVFTFHGFSCLSVLKFSYMKSFFEKNAASERVPRETQAR